MKDSLQIKRLQLLLTEPQIPTRDLHAIKADVLIMAGDRDIIRNKHTLEIFDNIPGALLCILPALPMAYFRTGRSGSKKSFTIFFEKPQQKLTSVQLMEKSMK